MAKRAVKKIKMVKKNKGLNPAAVEPAAPLASDKPGDGLPFWKLIAVIGVILAFLYGPSLFKGGVTEFQPAAKYFLLKKVIQINGSETQGKPFFANDIQAVGPHELGITDNLGGQVLIYDFNGKLIRKWGQNGSGPREFREPSGIGTDGKGHLFIMDTYNSKIKTFDVNGKLLAQLDLAQFGFFNQPRRINWGGNCLLVTSAGSSRLARLSPSGKFLGTIGDKATLLGGSWGISDAIMDGKGHFYVGDMNLKKSTVLEYDGAGAILRTIKVGVTPENIALDSQDRLFVGSYGDGSKVFDSNGNWLGFLVDEDQPTTPLNLITGIDITSDGLILTCGGDVITLYRVAAEKPKP